MRILLVEDDAALARSVRSVLERARHAVDHASTLSEARAVIGIAPWDAILLDLHLPDGDGLALIPLARRHRPEASIIAITAKDLVTDRIRGLDAGADDYLIKPFDPEELMARLRAIDRRKAGAGSGPVRVGDLVIDADRLEVTRGGESVELTGREWSLLLVLASRLDRVHRKEALLEAIYDFDAEIGPNVLEVHVHNLRKKLGPSAIQTVRGLGYRLSGRRA
ncbi:MAG: hypothetical protein RIS35_3697 [Pseudomonadota bacterium]|jgi:two-component system OmpR family response regulator